MKICKSCGKEIDNKAVVCVNCGCAVKTKKPIYKKVWFWLLVVVVVIAVASASGDNDAKLVTNTNTVSVSDIETTSTPSEEKDKFYVGETAELKDVMVTFVDVSENYGSTFNEPTEGNVYVLFELDIANNSNEELNISSMMCFEAYCDGYTCNYSLGALMEKENKNQLDGTVAPGKKMNGVIGYEVPKDWQEIEMVFTPDFWSSKSITFVATNN